MTAFSAQERQVPIIVCNTVADEEFPSEEMIAREKLQTGGVTFAVVDGITVILPRNARYIMQDKYQRWYFSEKYPVNSKDDWFPDKLPIQYVENGTIRLLSSKPNKNWRETRHKTIYREPRLHK